MQNATPGLTPPPMPPAPPVPRMPQYPSPGYVAPPPLMPPPYPYPYPYPSNKKNSPIVGEIAKIVFLILILLVGIYFFFQSDPGQDILKSLPWLARIIEGIGILTGAAFLYKAASRAGLLGKAKKVKQMLDDYKKAKSEGDAAKSEELEEELKDEGVDPSKASEGAESAEAAAAEGAEVAEGAGEMGEVGEEALSILEEI